ncbi:MAG TPA: aminotransferase class IV [Candidatus Omnitrophota bacterium]|nr:aminotransferase class IV [Candidatus Omnitrophota bacterium]
MPLTIYLNKNYIKVDGATFEALLPGNLEGEGAFETMRSYDGKIFAFDDHMKRLKRGLKHFHMIIPLSGKQILWVINELSRRNKLKNARVRVIVWRHNNQKFISISCQPLKLPSSKKYKTGFNVMTARYGRSRQGKSDVKSIDYRMLRKIFREAQSKGFDEAVLLNGKGEIVEGTRTNVFFVHNGRLYTPALGCGCLNGITRQKVIQCARSRKIPVKAARAPLKQLMSCDEAFLTGSTLEVMPVRSVDGRPIGKGKTKKFTQAIQSAYRSLVRRELARR